MIKKSYQPLKTDQLMLQLIVPKIDDEHVQIHHVTETYHKAQLEIERRFKDGQVKFERIFL